MTRPVSLNRPARTCEDVNRQLRAAGREEILIRGRGYYYFADGFAPHWQSTIVAVPRLSDLTIQQWLDRHQEFVDANRDREEAAKHKPKIGDERWVADHVSYKRWCDMARAKGWNGEDGNDGLRDYCEPEEAATVTVHASLDAAKAWAIKTFADAPDDSAFGAILIEHQVLEGAHDDSGNPVRGCPPEWETQRTYEVTSDGEMTECGQW